MSRVGVIMGMFTAILLLGCAGTRHLYEGERRPKNEVAILDVNLDCGARIIAIDSVFVTRKDSSDMPAYYKGRIALLPGRHVMTVFYQNTYYTPSVTDEFGMPTLTTYTFTTTKTVPFEVAGGETYKIDAEHFEVSFPPGALEWRAWVVEDRSGMVVSEIPAD